MADDWIDASKVDCLNMCPQKYFWRYEAHLKGIHEDISALTFGGAIHSSLELLYKNEAFNLVQCPDCAISQAAGCAYCKGSTIPAIAAAFLAGYPTDPEDPRNARTRSRGLEMLEVYLIKWGREPFKVLAVEQPFELEMGDFRYVGKMDLIVQRNDSIRPLDHKTTSFLGNNFEKGFKLSSQISGYIKACQVTTGEEVWDGEINALRITTRIDPDQSFFRMTTSRTPEELDRWQWDVTDAMRRIREYRQIGTWPRNAPYSCTAYNKLCEYYQLCTTGVDVQNTLRETAYKVEIWTPLPT